MQVPQSMEGEEKKKKKTVAGQKIDFHYEFQAIIVPINLTLLGFGFFPPKKEHMILPSIRLSVPVFSLFFFSCNY